MTGYDIVDKTARKAQTAIGAPSVFPDCPDQDVQRAHESSRGCSSHLPPSASDTKESEVQEKGTTQAVQLCQLSYKTLTIRRNK